jgi:cyclopropane fatty-acyl-phospholipid synthase-like methyltransferase
MWGPISEATIEDMVERVASLGIARASRVLDLGCGPAELLRRIVERTGASGVGVDASPFAIEEAHARVACSPAAKRIELRLADVEDIDRSAVHDLVICIGPGWDTGGWKRLTEWTARLVAPGGHLLLADGAWRRSPTTTELRALGMEMDAYPRTETVEGIVEEAGLHVLWSHTVAAEEWDAYGERYRDAMRSFVQSSPDDRLARVAAERSGPGWTTYELLHSLLDFVLVLGRPVPGRRGASA